MSEEIKSLNELDKLAEEKLGASPGDTIKTETKMSLTESCGYRCQVCAVINVVYNYAAPDKCLNCGSNLLKLVYKNILINTTIAKTIQI